jgi:hypothetical protein
MKRPVREKIFEAERRLRENSLGPLRQELETMRKHQQKSLEPQLWEAGIAEIERKLEEPQPQGLKDLWAYLLHEKDGRSWHQIGDQLYGNLKISEEARRERARRAWERADRRLELEPDGSTLADVISIGTIFS